MCSLPCTAGYKVSRARGDAQRSRAFYVYWYRALYYTGEGHVCRGTCFFFPPRNKPNKARAPSYMAYAQPECVTSNTGVNGSSFGRFKTTKCQLFSRDPKRVTSQKYESIGGGSRARRNADD